MVDWFRIFIGTETANNSVLNISLSKDMNDRFSMQKETVNTDMYRDVFKEVVFYTNKTAEKLEQVINDKPILANVVSILLKFRFLEMGLTTKEFPEYYDKEYFTKTKDLLDMIESQSKTRLSGKDEGDANRIVDIVLTDGAMREFIEGLKILKDLREVDLEIKKLQDQRDELMKRGKGFGQGKNKLVIWILIILYFAFICVMVFPGLIFQDLPDNPLFGISYTFCGPAIGIIPLAFVAYKLLGKSKEGNKQNDIIDKKRTEYSSIQKRSYSKEKMDKLMSLFGQMTYESALLKKQRNDEFVREFISENEFEQYFKLPSV
jgi:hypothetical protein